MSETANPVHFISHVHDRDTIYAKYECRAGEDADCRNYPDCECDGWSDCDHAKVRQGECWAAPWMSDSCAEECFVGPKDTPVHSGPVHISFNGDCVEWEYLAALPYGDSDNGPLDPRALVGIAPDFTGGLSVDEYMDEQRGRTETP